MNKISLFSGKRGEVGCLMHILLHFDCRLLTQKSDILLNVFLAIAVDNLADADSLSGVEKVWFYLFIYTACLKV